MLLSEIQVTRPTLTEETRRELLSCFILNEDDGGGGGDAGGGDIGDVGEPGDSETPETTPPPNYPGRPFLYAGANRWFAQLYASIRHLTIANNILKRMNELGLDKDAQKRVKMAAKVAAKHVTLLLSNPGATAYRIPVWTTQAPPKPVIRVWNEEFAKEFSKQLSKI